MPSRQVSPSRPSEVTLLNGTSPMLFAGIGGELMQCAASMDWLSWEHLHPKPWGFYRQI